MSAESSRPGTRSTTRGGRARRAQIERAAVEVLADLGYAAASIGRIAERAGVSKGVVTYHFASRNEILLGSALGLLRECTEHVSTASADAETPLDRLRTMIAAELRFFSTRRTEFLAMAEVMANHRDESFQHAFEETTRAELDALAHLLRQGQASGQLRTFDALEFAHLITATKNGALDRWAADEAQDLDSSADALFDFIEHATARRP